ncbi:MAG: sel1 repeat family protein [Oceanospirillum sp.]|nr:sel1 repeat family protein [Oceanospirillum sp.]
MMSEQPRLVTRFKFYLAEKLFHSSVLKGSKLRHQWVMSMFKQAANEGHLKALSIYGHLLYFRGASPVDKGQGANYLLDAAKQGDAKAQYQIGCIYEQGYGHLQKNFENAVRWFVRAAEQGHPLACRKMITACENGDLGLAKNPEQVQYWQQKIHRTLKEASGINLTQSVT